MATTWQAQGFIVAHFGMGLRIGLEKGDPSKFVGEVKNLAQRAMCFPTLKEE
ncbi:MAG: hypothetical protein ACRBM6_03225 [Geminicoccales bacterium]